MGMTYQNTSSDYKLINFNVPKYLIKNFDNLVKFKRVSRTSMLVHLIENYIQFEKQRIEDMGQLNTLIHDIEKRNRSTIKEEMIGLHREIEHEFEPPVPPTLPEEPDHSKDDWNDPSGVGRLWSIR